MRKYEFEIQIEKKIIILTAFKFVWTGYLRTKNSTLIIIQY